MNDITALAQRMKAAALKATPGEWVYLPSNTSIEYDYGSDDSQGSITYMDSGDFTQKQTELNGIFIALANPANVLTLVEALEAALKRNAELEEKQRLIDICQGQGLEHRIAAENRAEAVEKRMAELEISRDKCFLSGLKTGWEYGIADDTDGYNREIADAQLVIDRAASVAVEGDTNANNN